MAVALYPHNEAAYRSALGMMGRTGRAAVVHPTGTGKSFIAFRLAEEYYREHGDLKVPQTYTVETEGGRVWLGKWLAAQRKKRNSPGGRQALTEGQVQRLEAIGMEW